MMKGIVKAAKIATKIVEVFHWVGTALMLAATVCSLAAPAWVKYLVGINAKECCGAELNVYGFEVIAPVENGSIEHESAVFVRHWRGYYSFSYGNGLQKFKFDY